MTRDIGVLSDRLRKCTANLDENRHEWEQALVEYNEVALKAGAIIGSQRHNVLVGNKIVARGEIWRIKETKAFLIDGELNCTVTCAHLNERLVDSLFTFGTRFNLDIDKWEHWDASRNSPKYEAAGPDVGDGENIPLH